MWEERATQHRCTHTHSLFALSRPSPLAVTLPCRAEYIDENHSKAIGRPRGSVGRERNRKAVG